MGFPTQNDHFGVFWGYHHLRNHPYDLTSKFRSEFTNLLPSWGDASFWTKNSTLKGYWSLEPIPRPQAKPKFYREDGLEFIWNACECRGTVFHRAVLHNSLYKVKVCRHPSADVFCFPLILVTHTIHVWYIYLHVVVFFMINVGNYTIHGSVMGDGKSPKTGRFWNFIFVNKIIVPWFLNGSLQSTNGKVFGLGPGGLGFESDYH